MFIPNEFNIIIMDFIISRESIYDDRPCDEAVEIECTYRDERAVSTLAEAEKMFWYEGWYTRGINHREEDGYVVCDVSGYNQWMVSINGLVELVQFMSKYGNIVISKSRYNEYRNEITISDIY